MVTILIESLLLCYMLFQVIEGFVQSFGSESQIHILYFIVVLVYLYEVVTGISLEQTVSRILIFSSKINVTSVG